MTPLPAPRSLSVLKTDALDLGGNGILNAGDVINYTITVTNTGNVTVSNVSVSDPGTTGLACTPAAPFTLAPGPSVNLHGIARLTQGDINAGFYSNVATASGFSPNNTPGHGRFG
ncbi:MAG: DUF11 domain-containing protein [Saprospirales bacterium]|nr:DUF11 domain-containing protein [Saprospirales bacterium]